MRTVAEGAVERGWESRVVVASDDRQAHTDTLAGTTVVRTPTLARPLSLPLTTGYGRALAEVEADVLLIHEPTLLAAAALRAKPSVRDRFGHIAVWWHSDIVRQRALAPLYAPTIEQHLAAADRIIVATPNHITSSDVLGRFTDKIDVVPYGIDLDRYELTPEREGRVADLRAEFLTDPESNALIVYAGRFAHYKGIDHLVDAYEQLRGAHLVVAGDGPCRDHVTSSNAAGDGRLTVMGHLDADAFVDLLWAADVFVLPSIHNSEAFGIAQVEAMACRTPVVTYDLPTGVTWVNRDEETGLVARLGDVDALARAMQHLIDEPAHRRDLGAAAFEWAHATFGLDAMLDAVFDGFDTFHLWRPANAPIQVE